MRELTGHKVNPANDQLTVTVLDEPGQGGACHEYDITGGNAVPTHIRFQNGPIAEVGVNGVTHEALIAILIDRLEGFQAGEYANEYNDKALQKLKRAQEILQERTKERMARNVEGTHEK